MASRPGQSTRRIVVALDGPASSGKSSVGAAAAEQLQLRFVDTGLFYRALTALALLEGLDLDDPTALVPLVDRVSLGEDGSGRFTRVLLDGSDATEEARSPMVDRAVSIVARIPEVRAALLERQRELAADGGIVLAGRDIGTVVLPDADLKVFLDASVDERAQRRIEERGLDPGSPEAEEVREQLRARDAIDTSRDVAPLRAADDAVHVRTDGNAFDETVEIVAAEIAAVMMTPHPRSRTRSAPPPAVATATIEQAQPARPKRTRAPKAAVAESDGGGALAIAPAAELEQSPEDEPAAEREAASEPDATPDQEAPSEPEPRRVPADDAAAEAELEPAGQRSGSTRRSQKRTRATLRRASETGVANETAEKERIPEPELDTDSSAGPSSAAGPASAATRRSTKRTRATLRRAVEAVALADAGALSPDGTDAAAMATGIRASDETPTSEPDEAPTSKPDAPSPPEPELGPSIVTTPVAQPASTPTLRAQKRPRETARRAAAPTVAADAIAAPEAVMPRTRRDPILEAAMNLDNDQSMTVRMVALVARIGARLFADVDVQGLDHIPRRGPVILAVNHISNADPVVVGAWITDALKRRRIHWLGKRELFSWPVLGWIAARGGVHPVDRDSADVDAFRLATKILEAGYVLLVFPEGTRSPTGELQEAKDGAALLALRTGAQVVPIGVSNTDAVWRKGRALPLPFPRRRVTVRIGTPFRVQDAIPAETGRRQAKSLATTEIMGRIAALVDRRHRGVYAAAIRTDVAPEP